MFDLLALKFVDTLYKTIYSVVEASRVLYGAVEAIK